MSEAYYSMCPFTGYQFLISPADVCPKCKIKHDGFRYIKGKKIEKKKKKNQWVNPLLMQKDDFVNP